MSNQQQQGGDTRTLSQLVRQFQLLEGVKTRLIRMGRLSGDANVDQVEAALRQLVPADMFAKRGGNDGAGQPQR